ncbi:MAG: DUF58 domain-containing protein, partial [Peptococcaceae bacterium]|nr:DUF58 domain-containing protein [Peptococcaceae bacterium]
MTKSFRTSWLRPKFRAERFLPYLPTRRLLVLMLATTPPLILFAYWSEHWLYVFGADLAVWLLSLTDLLRLPRRREFQAKRCLTEEIERGQGIQVVLKFSCRTSAALLYFRLIDCLPESFADPFPLSGMVSQTAAWECAYETQASVRGDYLLDSVYLRYRSRIGFWEKQIVFHPVSTLRVIPNLDSVRSHLVTLRQALLTDGLRIKRNHPGSGEFAQVRSYVPGDDPRMINWRQSAKWAELMSNVYEPEHGKNITILIDCGRVMGIELQASNRLEKSLEAALTVAAVALKHGDYVSV